MAKARCRDCGSGEWTKDGRCCACHTFPTLGYDVAELIQDTCVIPDGDHAGDPYVLTDEMLLFLLRYYRLTPAGRFFFPRGGQLVRPQKWGKGPFGSAIITAEAHPEGPVRFDGWDSDGQPVGRPVSTPWIQVAAVSEDQTDNVWTALLPMIRLGSLVDELPDTGQDRINLPYGGMIEPVTSSGQSRLGQRITFALQDETHSWLANNQGHKVADTQRRNLAGMGGRFLETTNAWDPGEDSVAQRTGESKAPGVYRDDVEPGEGSVRNKAERRRMLRKVYGGSWWIDLDRIDTEIRTLLEHDPAQAERFFLNRKEAGESAAFDSIAWKALADPHDLENGRLIVIGVDGARFDDALAIVATHVPTGYQWPLDIIERPQNAPDDYEHDFGRADGVMVDAFERYRVWRVYIDPQKIDYLVDKWTGRWGEKRIISWFTNRPKPMAWAVRNYTAAIGAGDLSHDGDPVMAEHIRNAKKRKVNVFDDKRRQMHILDKDRHDSPRKKDAADAGVLSWEARGDAIAAGVTENLEPLVAWR